MDEKIVRLSDAVAKLLAIENKDKSLGEASPELNDYIITIKELVENGEITYEILQKEIAKHLEENENTLPGSLAQLLIGCVNDKGACPMKQNKAQDIPFAYDNKLNKIIPLSNQSEARNENSYAVLYFTGQPKSLDIESLKYLEDIGFRKLKIEYKTVASANYKTLYVENLSKYIYSQPEKGDDNLLYVIGAIILLIICYLFMRN